ncbi:hypothetical protein SAMN04488118_102211 [Epibacterium ulvae]|uniref:Uncharacterized protein n=1 Tax=Epibacterium ulvae TaxID=1156985 RepID=A0A1G5PW87_9RHOB|nr:hypothetical protein SAMN04488118_102211 [Epibacterium ulvae]
MIWAAAFPGILIGLITSIICYFKFSFPFWVCLLMYPFVSSAVILTLVALMFLFKRNS